MRVSNIKTKDNSTVQVEVRVLSKCQHDSLRVEEVDYGYADQALGDWVEDWHFAYVCNECDEVLEEVEC